MGQENVPVSPEEEWAWKEREEFLRAYPDHGHTQEIPVQ